MKLLYLIDVERAASRRRPLTGLHWVFSHYGPFALELAETLDAMDGVQVTTRGRDHGTSYQAAPEAPDGENWLTSTRRGVDRVIERFAPLALAELLDHVYFRTGPMIGARRGEQLDLQRARDHAEPRRRPPLGPAAEPGDVQERLARWRADTGRRLAPVPLEPPGRFFVDASDDAGGAGLKGTVDVIDGCGV